MDYRVKPGHEEIKMPPPVFRFAPSPNGYLHLGHAYSALLNFDLARRAGGRFLLRIEDIDATRCRPEFEDAIYQDLAWLGIAWETPVRRQSEHLADYREALERLVAQGLVYPSFESRAEIARLVAQREAEAPWPRDPDGVPLYPGTARSLSPDERARLLRIGRALCAAARYGGGLRARRRARAGSSTAKAREARPARWPPGPSAWGDVILARKETPTSYHLAVVDRRRAAGRDGGGAGPGPVLVDQRASVVAALLGLPQPAYRHHRLVLDGAGRKLSKSTEATGLRELRAGGATPAEIRRLVGLP